LNRGRNILLANSNTTDYGQGCQVSGFDLGGPVFEFFALVASPEYTGLVFFFSPLVDNVVWSVSCIFVETISASQKTVGYLRL